MFAFLAGLFGSIVRGLTLSAIAAENTRRPEEWATLMGLQAGVKQVRTGPEWTGLDVPIEIRERIAA